MVYYGLALGVNLIGGNIFVNSFMSGAIEIPSYIMVIPIMNRVGRRWTAIGSLVAAGLSCFVCIALFDRPGVCLYERSIMQFRFRFRCFILFNVHATSHTHARTRARVYTRTHICTHTHLHGNRLRTNTNAHIHTYTTRTHIHARTSAHTHTRTHKQTQTHALAQLHAGRPWRGSSRGPRNISMRSLGLAKKLPRRQNQAVTPVIAVS